MLDWLESVSYLAVSSLSLAQGKYPDSSRSIDMFIPFAPGGVTDISSRIFGDELAKVLKIPRDSGQQTRRGRDPWRNPCGEGDQGWLHACWATASAEWSWRRWSYPRSSLTRSRTLCPSSCLRRPPRAIIAKPDSPYKDINALVDAAKKNPGKLAYGSAGVGTDSHFNVEILSNVANLKFKHVPFKGSGEVGPAVMGSHVDFGTGAATTFMPLLKAGQVKPLAISGKVRMKQFPEARTFDEQGIKGDFIDNWTGFFVPVGTPQPVIDLLIQASQQVVKNREFIDRIEKAGGMVTPNTPAEFRAIIERDKKTAEEIAKKVGMQQK